MTSTGGPAAGPPSGAEPGELVWTAEDCDEVNGEHDENQLCMCPCHLEEEDILDYSPP